ncbi:MAG: hypothetical protein IT377_09070 [Polyangiaceae bacterium]|nr:hypothetical protein [Polyangiaceae bacterium]
MIFGRNRFLDAALTGLGAYSLALVWSACSGGGGGGGGLAPDGGFAGGGGGNPLVPEANAEQSGQRLKARRLLGADGSSSFLGWQDLARNEGCAFHHTVEGKLRCLPSGPSVKYGYANYFADPACTIPGAKYEAGCAPPKYLAVWADSDCEGSKVASIHPAVPAQKLYSKSSSGCEPTSTTDMILGAGPALPWTDFVEAAEKLDP